MIVPSRLTVLEMDAYIAHRLEMLADSPWAYSASPGNDRASDPQTLRASLADPEHAVFAVIENGSVLASATVLRQKSPKANHQAWIVAVYCTPGARGRGLGRAVVSAAIEAARGWSGVTCIRLSVSENSPAAKRLYESLGFKVWGLEPDALRVGDRMYSEYQMHLPVGGGPS